jgi:hypothetical protein
MMLDVTLGIFAGLLLPTGWAKLRKPYETARALRSVGWPGNRGLAISLGLVEVVVGAWVLGVGSAQSVIALGALYGGFLAWLAVAFRAGGVVSSCGCAGTPDTPPTAAHTILNTAALATVAIDLASTQPGISLPATGLLEWTTIVAIVVVGSWLALTLITSGARLTGILRS